MKDFYNKEMTISQTIGYRLCKFIAYCFQANCNFEYGYKPTVVRVSEETNRF
jgi:hypothetical protein